MVLVSHLWLVVPRICLPYMHNTLRNLETAGLRGERVAPGHTARGSAPASRRSRPLTLKSAASCCAR